MSALNVCRILWFYRAVSSYYYIIVIQKFHLQYCIINYNVLCNLQSGWDVDIGSRVDYTDRFMHLIKNFFDSAFDIEYYRIFYQRFRPYIEILRCTLSINVR